MFGSAESEKVRLNNREIIFAEFLYDHDTSTSQTDRQTDRRTICLDITAPRYASRGKKHQYDKYG